MIDALALLVRAVLALLCVLALIWWISRKAGAAHASRASKEQHLSVVARQNLGRRAGVAVVAIGPRRLLLGVTDQSINMLSELDPREDLGALAASMKASGADVVREDLDVESLNDKGFVLLNPEPSALAGSIFAPSTWRAALNTLRQKTIR